MSAAYRDAQRGRGLGRTQGGHHQEAHAARPPARAGRQSHSDDAPAQGHPRPHADGNARARAIVADAVLGAGAAYEWLDDELFLETWGEDVPPRSTRR